MIPFAKMRLGIDDAELGLILLVFGIGALITLPLTGWIVRQWGSRLIALLSTLAVITLLPLLAMASSVYSLSSTLFLFGFATSALNISINSQAVDVEARSRQPLMSSFHCLFSTGGLLGALLIGLFLELNLDLFLSASVISSIMLTIILFQWPYLIVEEKKVQIREKGTGFSDYRIILLGVMCFIAFMAEGSMLDWSAEFLRSTLHYDPAYAGIGYALFSIFMALGRLTGDKLIGTWGIFTIFRTGSLISACGFLAVNYLQWGHAQLLGFCLIGFGSSNMVPILFSTSGKLGNSSSDYSLTIVTSIGYVGMLIGPAFIGFIAEMTNLTFAFAGIAFLLVGVGLTGRFAGLAQTTSPELSR